jgi:hypothetical protein
MSGPKVVRVRTPEELAAECHTLINALRAEIQDFEAFARRHDVIDTTAAQHGNGVVQDLIQKVEAREFETVRRICQAEVTSIRFAHQQVEEDVLRQATEAASRRRRCQYLAASLARKLQLRGQAVPPEIEQARLGRIGKTDHELLLMEAAVSSVLANETLQAAQEEHEKFTDEQQRLAELLLENEPESAEIPNLERQLGPVLSRLDRAMAEVRTLDASVIGNRLLERMHVIVNEPAGAHTAMRIDSLILEWAQRRKALRDVAGKHVRASQLMLDLAAQSDERARELTDQLANAKEAELDAVLSVAQTHVEQKVRARAAMQRRKAVLRGLAALGYEVGSQLSTLWAERGRAVVTRPDRPGYGVELSGPPDTNQMQVKVVAFAAQGLDRDAARDRDAETQWCADFAKLQALLGREGTSLSIVRALGVGAAPVAQVENMSQDEYEQTAGRLQNRSQP